MPLPSDRRHASVKHKVPALDPDPEAGAEKDALAANPELKPLSPLEIFDRAVEALTTTQLERGPRPAGSRRPGGRLALRVPGPDGAVLDALEELLPRDDAVLHTELDHAKGGFGGRLGNGR